jgi:hypothetical protein
MADEHVMIFANGAVKVIPVSLASFDLETPMGIVRRNLSL